ncbi:UNVERIFIED_CONTAM: FIP1V-like protein [Sesamum indicum]
MEGSSGGRKSFKQFGTRAVDFDVEELLNAFLLASSFQVNLRGRTERESGVNDTRKHQEEASSDDEQAASRRGRSKLERWTSHKERDFNVTSTSSSSLKKNKDVETYNSSGASLVSRVPDEPPKKVEGKPQPSVDDKDPGGETNNANPKVMEDKHLDTVAKLKKRSERFKLPLPSEKDTAPLKKMESEPLPPPQTENRTDSEIKPERPARKRRWTGN